MHTHSPVLDKDTSSAVVIKDKQAVDHTVNVSSILHQGKRKHICSYCGRMFNSTSHLKDHERLHTGDRPFKCQVCKKSFVQKSNLRQHLKFIHHQDHPGSRRLTPMGSEGQLIISTGCRPHICGVCGNSFTKLSHLKDHVRLHTGERPFECSVCQKRFVQKSHMKSHFRVHLEINSKTLSTKIIHKATSQDEVTETFASQEGIFPPSLPCQNSSQLTSTIAEDESPLKVLMKTKSPPLASNQQLRYDLRSAATRDASEVQCCELVGNKCVSSPSSCGCNESTRCKEFPSMVKTYFAYEENPGNPAEDQSVTRNGEMLGDHIEKVVTSLNEDDISCNNLQLQKESEVQPSYNQMKRSSSIEDESHSHEVMPPKKAYVRSMRISFLDDKVDPSNVVHHKSNDMSGTVIQNETSIPDMLGQDTKKNFVHNEEQDLAYSGGRDVFHQQTHVGLSPQSDNRRSDLPYDVVGSSNTNYATHIQDDALPKLSPWGQIGQDSRCVFLHSKTGESYKTSSSPTLFSSYPKAPTKVFDSKLYRERTLSPSPCRLSLLTSLNDDFVEEDEVSYCKLDHEANIFIEAQQRYQLERVVSSISQIKLYLGEKHVQNTKPKNPFAVPNLPLSETLPFKESKIVPRLVAKVCLDHDKDIQPQPNAPISSSTNGGKMDKTLKQVEAEVSLVSCAVPPPLPLNVTSDEYEDDSRMPSLKVGKVWSLSDPNAKQIFPVQDIEACQQTIQEADSTCLGTPHISPCSKTTKKRQNAKEYVCEICKKEFANSSHYNSHQRVHTGERPFSCQICAKSFKFTSNLKTHMKIHSVKDNEGEAKNDKNKTESNKCPTCGKEFLKINALKTHLTVHEGVRTHVCQQCGKSFRKTSHLKDHIRLHTGERPYSCTFCDRTFVQKSNLTSHLRVHEREKIGVSRQRMKPWLPVDMNKFHYEQKQYKLKQELIRAKAEKAKAEIRKCAAKKVSNSEDEKLKGSERSSVIVFNMNMVSC